MEYTTILTYISVFSGLTPLALFFVYKSQIKQICFVWLALLILSSFLVDLTSLFISLNYYKYFGNFYDVLQFILFILIYRELYLKEKKDTIVFISLIYLAFEIGNSIFFQSLDVNQTWSWTFSSIIILGLSAGYLWHLLKSNIIFNLTKFGPFWINMAALLYFGFSLYLFVMAEYVFTNVEADKVIIFWSFHNINNILKNCIFALGIYRANKKKDADLSITLIEAHDLNTSEFAPVK